MHHNIHAIHVDASRGDICRHEHGLHPGSEGPQGTFTLRLAQTPVEGTGPDSRDDQFA